MYVQPLEGQLGPASLFSGTGEGAGPNPAEFAPGSPVTGDAISRLIPPWLTGAMTQNPMQTAMFGPVPALMQQLMQMLQWMMGSAGMGAPYGSGGSCSPPPGNEQYFPNATGGSNGDPHLSFNGNTWNSMVSQPDLLDSDSIPGGFRVSTQTTPPNAKGVTYNQSATVSMNNGATMVSMNDNGQPSITNFGQNVPIAAGQTVQLGNGTSVTCNQNGSLSVTAQNGMGGQITTSLTAKGEGVNVDVSAQNVDLGGALVNGNQQQQPPPGYGPIPQPPPGFGPIPQPPIFGPTPQPPIYGPIPSPIGGPITGPIPAPYPIINPPIVNPPLPPIQMHPNAL
jgi:hypothetical protein